MTSFLKAVLDTVGQCGTHLNCCRFRKENQGHNSHIFSTRSPCPFFLTSPLQLQPMTDTSTGSTFGPVPPDTRPGVGEDGCRWSDPGADAAFCSHFAFLKCRCRVWKTQYSTPRAWRPSSGCWKITAWTTGDPQEGGGA